MSQKGDILYNGEKNMMTSEDLIRVQEDAKKRRLDNLAKACANADSDEMKSLWYDKLRKLAEQYNMMDYFRSLIH
jgi:hypothetical protein